MQANGEVFVHLGKEAVWMPEPLGEFLRQLPWRRQVGIAGNLKQSAWLFRAARPVVISIPGTCAPGSPASASSANPLAMPR
ncbi:MAG: hypothetical protein H0U16_05390 [Actinobacteria bacterium]|nr:hypothetical protein [Actinomycetota bacterium]